MQCFRANFACWAQIICVKANEIDSIEPLAVSKRTVIRLIGSVRIVQRWLYHSRKTVPEGKRWVTIAVNGGPGRQTLIDYASLKAAYARLLQGDAPPLLPCEVKAERNRLEGRTKRCSLSRSPKLSTASCKRSR